MRLNPSTNKVLIAWLAEQAERPLRRPRVRRRLAIEELRCHPDLCTRLESASAGLDGVRMRYLTGLPLLVHPNGVAFGVASGTAWIAIRLPGVGHGAVVHTKWGRRGLEGDWTDADPWLTDMESHEGTARLRGWARAAYAHATEVGPSIGARRVSRPRPRTG